MWVVYDKDGYSKHAETFDYAKRHNVKIAFSSISFETWILLHFGYTTRAFEKSEKIISYLKHKYHFDYSKNDYDTFNSKEYLKSTRTVFNEFLKSSESIKEEKILSESKEESTQNHEPIIPEKIENKIKEGIKSFTNISNFDGMYTAAQLFIEEFLVSKYNNNLRAFLEDFNNKK